MPPKTKKVKNEKQVLWTLQERFAVWHLLHDNKFALNDQGWRTIWQEIAVVDRDLQTVWDDYTQRSAPSRGAMYRKSIDKRNYTPEEAAAYENACAEVHRAAKKHGIKLRARPYKASSKHDKKKDDDDNDDGGEEDNEKDPKVKVATSSRAKPKPQTSKQKSETTQQKPGRKMKDAKPKDTPQEKTPAAVKRVAQKQPRTKQNDQSKKQELRDQHDLLDETSTDIDKYGLLPPQNLAAAQALEEAARLSRSQFVSSRLNVERAVASTALTPQKRKSQGTNLLPAAGSLQDQQDDVEMSDADEEQQNESLDVGRSNANDDQRPVKKTRSTKPQNDNGNIGLLKAALQGAHRQRSQTPASEQEPRKASSKVHVQQTVSAASSNTREISNDVGMTYAEGEKLDRSTAAAIRYYKVPAANQGNGFDNWWQDELNRILLGPAYDLLPKRKASVTEECEELDFPLYPAQRVAAFFLDMYGGQLLGEGFTHRVEDLLIKENITNLILTIDRELSVNMSVKGISPRYELGEVFTSPLSPFSNFRLASAVFGEGLQMLHKMDIDYSGPASQQLVACAKLGDRHPTPEDYQFVNPNEPAFKRGGRVHKLYVRQQECPILGDNKRWNTAYVYMDVMLCQQEDCEKCSGYGGAPLLTATSLPRVHMRHTAGKVGEGKIGVFDQPEVRINARYNKDEDGKFVVNLAYGVVPMEFWDGTIQDVVLCDQDSCQGCREAHGALPFPKKDGGETGGSAGGRP